MPLAASPFQSLHDMEAIVRIRRSSVRWITFRAFPRFRQKPGHPNSVFQRNHDEVKKVVSVIRRSQIRYVGKLRRQPEPHVVHTASPTGPSHGPAVVHCWELGAASSGTAPAPDTCSGYSEFRTYSTVRWHFAGLRSFPKRPLEEWPYPALQLPADASARRSLSPDPSAASPAPSADRRIPSVSGSTSAP